MKNLSLHNVASVNHLTWPQAPQDVTIESPALMVVTDFSQHVPLVVNHQMRAVEAEAAMRRQHVRLKFVVDDHEEFLGVVGLEDLNDEEILKKVASGFERSELSVSDFMCPRRFLYALDYAELEQTQIHTLLEALGGYKRQHCLVVDGQPQRIRGIVSASDVARKIKLPLDLSVTVSFQRVWRVLNRAV